MLLRGWEAIETSFLQEAYYVISFSYFLDHNIGLITSDKNFDFVPLPRFFFVKLPIPSPQKSED